MALRRAIAGFHSTELVFVVWMAVEGIVHEVEGDGSRLQQVENRHRHHRKDVVDGVKHGVFLRCVQPIHHRLTVWCVFSIRRDAIDRSRVNSSPEQLAVSSLEVRGGAPPRGAPPLELAVHGVL